MGSRQSRGDEAINNIVQKGFEENYKFKPIRPLIKGIKKNGMIMPKGTKSMNGKTKVKGKK
mgnify:CR=1 FL=1